MASEEYGLDLQTEEGWRRVLARYWGNITLVDRSVRKILSALEESGQADNTIVVFTSDHGEMTGYHGILGKTLMYEESVRVPMLIRAPMLGTTQKKIPGNFSHIDLVPTLLDLMETDRPDTLQGQSRTPVLRGESTLASNDVYIEWSGADGHPPRSIGEAEVNRSMGEPLRTVISSDRWKLNLYEQGQHELYDLNTDPHEMNNLIDTPIHQDRIRNLTDRIRRWQMQTGDTVPLPEG
ncbi:MAG: sulfatase-like hydrolase/transferase [Candidatus Latescibacteria bacterium]|nr:sulfatase-like hydrolase/transferase [Candidatus Latescibacterota bacterium]